ncbi:MAG: ThiF family adenylyltransferase [Bryobacteraceae bacterium]|jgi:molybdopterin/thiamine biosynthesis adenylyltransferase
MSEKSIVVAGAGGNIGSHLTPHLARMPQIGRVTLIDREVYERRNAANQDIVGRDVGKPKALVQARRLVEIRPNLEVNAIHAPLEMLPLGAWRADLILACLDSRAARQAVNERAWRLGIPWADSGVLGSEWLARVNVYAPASDAPCLECAWSDEDYGLREQEYPCRGGAVAPAPNGASSELGALAAAMLALECRKILDGELERAATGRQATFNARWHRFAVTSFRRNPRCRFDHATWRIEPLRCRTREMRISDLLAMAGSIRVPGQRFIRRLVCPACKGEKQLFSLEGSLDEHRLRCGACRRLMAAPGFDTLECLDGSLPADALSLTLDQAGLRYGDVLQAGDRFFEIARNGVMESEK